MLTPAQSLRIFGLPYDQWPWPPALRRSDGLHGQHASENDLSTINCLL